MQKLTEFKGWANEIDYLASESERQAKTEASIALYKREEAQHWTLGQKMTLFIGVFLVASLALCWWLAGVLDSLFKAAGR